MVSACVTVNFFFFLSKKVEVICQSNRYEAMSLHYINLGPSINRLVTDGNTKLCCQGFVLVLFQSTTAYKIDSEHTPDYMKVIPSMRYSNKHEVIFLGRFLPIFG